MENVKNIGIAIDGISSDIRKENLLRAKKRSIISGIKVGLRYLTLATVGIAMLYPLVWLLGASFKTNADIFTNIGFIPKDFKFDFSGYINGWKTSTEYTFTTYFINTFKIVIPKVALTIVSAVLTAYGFARFKFPGKKIMFGILISTLLLPNVVLRIPQFLMYKNFGWLDTYLPLFVPAAFATDTFFVFMLIQFIRGLPKEIEEAACVDGCIFNKTVGMVNDFKKYFISYNQSIYENPSPGNKEGGISTLEDKSLGCTQKSGVSKVKDVLRYGEVVKSKGLVLLEAPGNDLVATTALGTAGAHIVLFTTGRGTPYGGFVPTIKISTNSELARKKPKWIDFDAGKLLNSNVTMKDMLNDFVDYIIEVVEGRKTNNEISNFKEIAIFKNGVTL